jgi:hypothetical protein
MPCLDNNLLTLETAPHRNSLLTPGTECPQNGLFNSKAERSMYSEAVQYFKFVPSRLFTLHILFYLSTYPSFTKYIQ